MKEKVGFKITKWIFLSLSVVINTFLIVHACLSSTESAKWSNWISSIFETTINEHNDGVNPPSVIATNLTIEYSSSYTYNNVKGYEDNLDTHYLPLGCTKVLTATLSPKNVTDKKISYTVDNPGIVTITQQSTGYAITGIKTGIVNVTATSSSNKDLSVTWKYEVVDLIEPESFELVEENLNITVGGGNKANIIINDSANLCNENNEYDQLVFLPRYFDVDKLSYESLNEDIVQIKEVNGVKNIISGISEGDAQVKISSGSCERILNVHVGQQVAGNNFPEKDNLKVYVDDLDNARKDYNNTGFLLNLEDAIYASKNPVNVRVFNDGRVIGYRMPSSNDILTTISVINTKDLSITHDYDVTLTIQPLKKVSIALKGLTMKDNVYSSEQGKQYELTITTTPSAHSHVHFAVTSSNQNVATISNSGNIFFVNLISNGEVDIQIVCVEQPEISASIHISVSKRGVINNDNRTDFYQFMRKAAGHFFLFLLDGIVTTITLYMFLIRKKKWLYLPISFGTGFAIAGITELIQYFVPTRSGLWRDVGINTLGYLIGLALVALVILIINVIIKYSKKKKE